MKPIRQKTGAIAARNSKAKPIRPRVVKRAPNGWYGDDGKEPDPVVVEVPRQITLNDLPDSAAHVIDNIEELSEADAQRLREALAIDKEYRNPEQPPEIKLSKTFEEVAIDLGLDDASERVVLLNVVFKYAANRYKKPNGKNLQPLNISVFQNAFEHDHISLYGLKDKDPEVWLRRDVGSLTPRISEWGHLDKINEPLYFERKPFQDEAYLNGVQFTCYYLTEEFKREFIKAAVAWDAERDVDAELSLETQERVAALG